MTASASPSLVSIVTPTKNRRDLLRLTMASVAAQTYGSWEHVIVDDGSDDGTIEEVEAAALRDPRIRLIRRPGDQGGSNVCRNLGLREARGSLVVFLDSDDQLRSHCLELRAGMMDRNKDIAFSVFRAGVYNETPGDLPRLFHEHPPCDDLLAFLSSDWVWEITGPIWRKSYLDQIGGFDETLLNMQDVELHVRALCGRGRYLCFDEVDHDINWRADYSRVSVTYIYNPRVIEAAARVRRKLLELVSGAGLLTWSRKRALTGMCFIGAESLARLGGLRAAFGLWATGSRELDAPRGLWLAGAAMLVLARIDKGRQGPAARVVNKWKGWVRFRQEAHLI